MISNEFVLETAIAILSMKISDYVDNIEYTELDNKINRCGEGICDIVPKLFQEEGIDIKQFCRPIYNGVLVATTRLNQEFKNQNATITVAKMIDLDKCGAKFEVMSLFNIDSPNSFWDNFRSEEFNYEPIAGSYISKVSVPSYLIKKAIDAIYPDIFARAGINHKNGKDIWLETTEDRYDDLLNCLPPVFMDRNSFLSSEPYYHTVEDEEVCIACKSKSDTQKWFLKLMTRKEYLNEFRKVS
jgi:hypothetical protein